MRRRGCLWVWGFVTALCVALGVAALEPFFGVREFPPIPTPLPTPSPVPTRPFPPTATPRPLPSPTPTPTPPPWDAPPTRYRLDVTLDYFQQELHVRQEVRYLNATGRVLGQIPLVLDPARARNVLTQLEVLDSRGEPLSVTLEGHRLTVPLPQPLPPGQWVTLTLRYTLNLPKVRSRQDLRSLAFLGYTPRQTNLADWYAFVPPYHPDQGWMIRTPWFYGEHLVYPVADIQVRLKVQNAPAGLLVATNAEAVPCPQAGDGMARCYRLRQARQVVFSLSPYFRRVTLTTDTGLNLEGYFFIIEEQFGRDVLQATAHALEVFGALFGPYHRSRLVVVQGDLPDSAAYDGLYLLSERLFAFYGQEPASFLIAQAVHEVAHQWWQVQVANDPARHPWMDESLATYAEALFYEHQYPEGLAWWWTYRVDYYEPQGPIDGGIYQYTSARAYRDAVYLRGAYFWRDMRETVGDAAFFAFLQRYRETLAGGISTPERLFAVLEAVAPEAPWREVVERYFQAPPLP